MSDQSSRWLILGLTLLALLARLIGLSQPIVEHYVGRQIPTAMVARNLMLGSGFLHPQLDTGPFPNEFLVEPPLMAELVASLSALTNVPPGACGRLVSAMGIGLASLGLGLMVLRRQGGLAAVMAVSIFNLLPVVARFGRVMQPDALMLGCLVLGLACWDRGTRGARVVSWLLLAIGLALKMTSLPWVVCLLLVLGGASGVSWPSAARTLAFAGAAMLPGLAWYAWVLARWRAGGESIGSAAGADSARVWLEAMLPSAWLRRETLSSVGRGLLLRSFSPLGVPLACLGWWLAARSERVPRRLVLGLGLGMLLWAAPLGGKLHHDYYWLVASPWIAWGLVLAIVSAAPASPVTARGWVPQALVLGATVLVVAWGGVAWSRSLTLPAEWSRVEEAGRLVERLTAPEDWVVAPEALLYFANRRGCRLEYGASSQSRAAGEWRGDLESSPSAGWDSEDPLALIEFYRRQGAVWFADVAPDSASLERVGLQQMVRNRYEVVWDEPGVVLIARLAPVPVSPTR